MSSRSSSLSLLSLLPDTSLREHLLLNSRVYDTYALMAAEVRAVVMARTTWSGQGCCLSRVREEGCEGLLASKRQPRKARKAKEKAQNTRMVTPSRKMHAITVARLVTLHVNVRRKKASNASSSGGGGVHCLTYTDDQSNWIMMLAEVGQNQEQSNNMEFLVKFWNVGWPFKTKSVSSRGGTILTATGAPVTRYAGCVSSIGGRAWCGNQCEGDVRIASCSPSNPECESSC